MQKGRISVFPCFEKQGLLSLDLVWINATKQHLVFGVIRKITSESIKNNFWGVENITYSKLQTLQCASVPLADSDLTECGSAKGAYLNSLVICSEP